MGLCDFCKLFPQYLSNLPVILLPCALEERLIRCVLDERVFEEVARLLSYSPLIENLGLHQFDEVTL